MVLQKAVDEVAMLLDSVICPYLKSGDGLRGVGSMTSESGAGPSTAPRVDDGTDVNLIYPTHHRLLNSAAEALVRLAGANLSTDNAAVMIIDVGGNASRQTSGSAGRGTPMPSSHQKLATRSDVINRRLPTWHRTPGMSDGTRASSMQGLAHHAAGVGI